MHDVESTEKKNPKIFEARIFNVSRRNKQCSSMRRNPKYLAPNTYFRLTSSIDHKKGYVMFSEKRSFSVRSCNIGRWNGIRLLCS